VEFGRLLDRQIGRVCPLQNLVDVAAAEPLQLRRNSDVTHQPAVSDLYDKRVYHRQPMLGREFTEARAVGHPYGLAGYDQPLGALPEGSVERGRDVSRAPDVVDLQCNTQRSIRRPPPLL
jgi:hypothetical protein